MKKYIKPEIYYEEFQMSRSIAACGWQVGNSNDAQTCGATGDARFSNPSVTLFTSGAPCELDAASAMSMGLNFNFYCYMTGAFSEGDKTFRS